MSESEVLGAVSNCFVPCLSLVCFIGQHLSKHVYQAIIPTNVFVMYCVSLLPQKMPTINKKIVVTALKILSFLTQCWSKFSEHFILGYFLERTTKDTMKEFR